MIKLISFLYLHSSLHIINYMISLNQRLICFIRTQYKPGPVHLHKPVEIGIKKVVTYGEKIATALHYEIHADMTPEMSDNEMYITLAHFPVQACYLVRRIQTTLLPIILSEVIFLVCGCSFCETGATLCSRGSVQGFKFISRLIQTCYSS